ncbi:MAG: ATPase [candidate division Zixibacteria bacterium]|nr:ATPase [candidate division Zixibacteria bacterium]
MKHGMRRRDKGIKQRRHDVYKQKGKLSEGTICSTCGVVFAQGRWVWNYDGETSKEITCPACQRIRDGYPAGFIDISGEFFDDNREEILNLARNLEELHKEEHPMQRIMRIRKNRDGITQIETTEVNLARRIGDAISRAYQGEYSFQYADNYKRIRIQWVR